MVVTRLLLLKRQGIAALKFGHTHKTDFLILPFTLFYFYLVFATAFGLPTLSTKKIFHSGISECVGVAFCFTGLSFLLWSRISFGKSFRVGIDPSRPGKLVTDGIFAYSRNPIYVGFAFYPDRPISSFLKLDTPDLCARGFLAFSPSGST